jgi:hypothetical protein
MSDIQGLRAQIRGKYKRSSCARSGPNIIKDNFEAIFPGMKVLILVRKEPIGGHRAYIVSRPDHNILIQDNSTAIANQTVVDALTSLLDKTCVWLGEDEHRRAEVALRRLGRWISDSHVELGRGTVVPKCI